MSKQQTPSPSPKLYWNQNGAVACDRHTPFKGSDTWRNENWMPISDYGIAEYRKTLGREAACEICAEQEARKR